MAADRSNPEGKCSGAHSSRASTTNDPDSPLLLRKYWEKPPLLTSDSIAQMATKTFLRQGLTGKILFSNLRLLRL